MVQISVLICTYNRAAYLGGAIDSCLAQSLGSDQYEILVADNNSNDGTKALVAAYQEGHNHVRYLFEPQQGLNVTRTTAARAARGQYIAYLDDDARAQPQWLEALLVAFARSPAPVCVGGKIFLDWEGPRPSWYPPQFDALHAYLDHGDEGFYLQADTKGHYLIGTNMAFLKQTVLDFGGFRTHCGRLKRRSISGAETEMINRILRCGLPVYYEPHAVVQHIVVPERRTRRFMLKRILGDGATQPLLDLDTERFRNVNLLRRIFFDARQTLAYLLKAAGHFLLLRREQAMVHFLYAAQRWGRTDMEIKFLYHKEFAPLWRERRQRFKT